MTFEQAFREAESIIVSTHIGPHSRVDGPFHVKLRVTKVQLRENGAARWLARVTAAGSVDEDDDGWTGYDAEGESIWHYDGIALLIWA